MIYDTSGNPLYTESQATILWYNGAVSSVSGAFSRDATDYYTSIFSSLLYSNEICTAKCPSGYILTAAYYSDRKASAFISGASGTSITIPASRYVMLSLKKSDNSKTVPDDGAKVIVDGDFRVVTKSVEGVNLGQKYRTARLRELTEVEVMPTASYPLTNGDASIPSTPFIGIPYSAATKTEGYVGTDISLYTYLSAVKNPNSVIYTEKFENYLARCYYGTDCAGTFWAGMSVHDTLTTLVMQTSDTLEEVGDLALLQVGDALLKNGHCECVCYVEKDEHDRIVFIGVNDAWTPYMRRTWYWWDELVSHVQTGGHRLLRYKKLYDSDGSPFNYPFPGDPGTEFVFPKIMPKLGDKVAIKAGTDVVIHVLDTTGFSNISVYKNGTQIATTSTVAGFTMEDIAVGKYEVRMTGSAGTESCFFHVGDISMAVSGNTATFSASGGFTPYMISAYKKDSVNSSGWATDFTGKKVVHFITPEEISAGTADITDLVTYATQNQGYLKIKGYDDFGTIFEKVTL